MSYNGWKNRETWNVALWIGNDEGLYRAAKEFMGTYKGRSPYREFVSYACLEGKKTGDGVRWLDAKLAMSELNNMMREM